MARLKILGGKVMDPINGEGSIDPTKTLDYVKNLANNMVESATIVQAMVEEAKERGIKIYLDNNVILDKFSPKGEYELMLIKMNERLHALKSMLYSQGVLMTKPELDNRLKIMADRKKNAKV